MEKISKWGRVATSPYINIPCLCSSCPPFQVCSQPIKEFPGLPRSQYAFVSYLKNSFSFHATRACLESPLPFSLPHPFAHTVQSMLAVSLHPFPHHPALLYIIFLGFIVYSQRRCNDRPTLHTVAIRKKNRRPALLQPNHKLFKRK